MCKIICNRVFLCRKTCYCALHTLKKCADGKKCQLLKQNKHEIKGCFTLLMSKNFDGITLMPIFVAT